MFYNGYGGIDHFSGGTGRCLRAWLGLLWLRLNGGNVCDDSIAEGVVLKCIAI